MESQSEVMKCFKIHIIVSWVTEVLPYYLLPVCPPGIFIEGLGSFLDGMFGTGNGTTSTSINVGVVGITKVSILANAVCIVCAIIHPKGPAKYFCSPKNFQ